MKLVRFGAAGLEKPGMIGEDGSVRDLSGIVADVNRSTLAESALEDLRRIDPGSLPAAPANVRLGIPIDGIRKCVCIGRNYAEHIAESGDELPNEPIMFMKVDTSLTGPNDPIIMPKGAACLDWEVELAVVIGAACSCVDSITAARRIAGYMLANDYSEREFQERREGQWVKGKGCDTFAPVGPWFVSADEIRDPQKLGIWLEVNGKRQQDGSTSQMITNCASLVAYVSQFMTLRRGDIILTGTPSGVGGAQKPPKFLNVGDKVRAGIDGLGIQQQTIVSWSSPEACAFRCLVNEDA